MYIRKLPLGKLEHVCANLSFYFRSKSNDQAFMNHILDKKSRRRDLIQFIKMVKPIYSGRILPKHTRLVSRLLAKDGRVYKRGTNEMGILLCNLVNHMFINDVLNWKLNALSKAKAVKNKDSIATKIRKTKGVLESIANETNNK